MPNTSNKPVGTVTAFRMRNRADIKYNVTIPLGVARLRVTTRRKKRLWLLEITQAWETKSSKHKTLDEAFGTLLKYLEGCRLAPEERNTLIANVMQAQMGIR